MEPEPEKLVDIQPTKPKPKSRRIKKEQIDITTMPEPTPVPTPMPVKKPRKKPVENPVSDAKPKTKLVKGSEAAKLRMQELRAMKKAKTKS
ncbi:MAG: hypothetical protein ACO26X_03525 [Candidatus Fonsibacter ubiquis]